MRGILNLDHMKRTEMIEFPLESRRRIRRLLAMFLASPVYMQIQKGGYEYLLVFKYTEIKKILTRTLYFVSFNSVLLSLTSGSLSNQGQII